MTAAPSEELTGGRETLPGTWVEATGEGALEAVDAGRSLGRYIVIGTLGTGGMGVVHAAYDPQLDRKVAIKLLHPLEAESQAAAVRARLLREAQAIAKLSHPNVVAVHDVGIHEERVFVAMEFVDGGTLGEWMGAGEGPRPWREVLERMIPAGEGLAAAHAAGLVHRDFKPANVLLGTDGRPRVADFGIARSTGEASSEREAPSFDAPPAGEGDPPTAKLTRTGALVGTPAYMAPEQFSGADVDARADQFAFCVTLYEALYGERPFAAKGVHGLMLALHEGRVRRAPAGSKVPPWLRELVLRGLEPKPEERWPDMNALLDALRYRPQRGARRFGAFAALGVALVAALVAIIHDREPTAQLCAPPERALTETWSASREAELGERFAALELAEVEARLGPRLDDWARRWRSSWVEACEATQLRGEQSELLLDRRMSCLERGRRRVATFVEVLAEADEAQARAALDDLDDLDDLARCNDREAMLAAVPAPEDPERRARVEALAAELDEVYALVVAGEWERASAALDELEASVEAEGWRPLAAEFAHLRGRVGLGTRELEAGEQALRRAQLDALAVGDEHLAAEALTDLAELIAEWESRHDEALAHLDVAGALADHLDDDALRGAIELRRASTLEFDGEYERALAAVRRSAEALTRAHGERSLALTRARHSESMILYRLGRIEDSRASLDAAREAWGEGYGPTHPMSLRLLNAAGVLAGAAGDWRAAEQAFAKLVKRREQVFGPDHLDVSDALANLGGAQLNLGELEASRRSQERALEIREREMGADNLYVGHSLANLAPVYAGLGEHERAVAAIRRAFEIIAATRGAQHPDTMIAHSLVAEVVLHAGDHAAALEEYRAARELAEELGSPLQRLEFDLQIARAQLNLGRLAEAEAALERGRALMEAEQIGVPLDLLLVAYVDARLAQARGDQARARAQAAVLREQLERSRAGGVSAVAEAEAWLDEHFPAD